MAGLASSWVLENKALWDLRAVDPRKAWKAGPWGMRPWWPWGRGACREWEAELESDPRVLAGVHSFPHRSFIH